MKSLNILADPLQTTYEAWAMTAWIGIAHCVDRDVYRP